MHDVTFLVTDSRGARIRSIHPFSTLNSLQNHRANEAWFAFFRQTSDLAKRPGDNGYTVELADHLFDGGNSCYLARRREDTNFAIDGDVDRMRSQIPHSDSSTQTVITAQRCYILVCSIVIYVTITFSDAKKKKIQFTI